MKLLPMHFTHPEPSTSIRLPSVKQSRHRMQLPGIHFTIFDKLINYLIYKFYNRYTANTICPDTVYERQWKIPFYTFYPG